MIFKKLSLFLNSKHKLYLVIHFANQILMSLIEMVSLSLIPIFIYYVQDLEAAQEKINSINNVLNFQILNSDIKLIITYSFFGFIFLIIIKNLFMIFSNYFELYISRDLTRFNLNRIFKSYINQSLNSLIKKDYASFTRNLQSEIGRSTGFILAHVNIIKESIMLLAIFLILLINDTEVTLFVLFFFILMSITLLLLFKDKLLKKGKQSLEAQSKVISSIFNSVHVIKEMKIYNLENFFINELDKNYQIKAKNDNYKAFVSKLPRNIFEIVFVLLFTLIIIFIYYFNKGDTQTILATTGLLVAASMRILPSFTVILQSHSSLTYSKPSFTIIANELENKEFIFEEKRKSDEELILYKDFDKLNFKNLSFKYDKGLVFENLDFSFKKNKITGIVGKTGSGKSTLLNIITGLLEIQNGSIYLNGEKEIKKNFKLDFSIGYVPQDTFLIDASVGENIALGNYKEKFDLERLNFVIDFCELREVIDNLKFGINTRIGQKGSFLSGGQRQRLNIARALYRSPDLLILDESTNALDQITKMKLMDKIKKNVSNFTVLIVTHDNDLSHYFDEVINLK